MMMMMMMTDLAYHRRVETDPENWLSFVRWWLRYIYSIVNYQEPGLALTHFSKTH